METYSTQRRFSTSNIISTVYYSIYGDSTKHEDYQARNLTTSLNKKYVCPINRRCTQNYTFGVPVINTVYVP